MSAMSRKFIDFASWGPGRSFLIGGAAVLASLGTFYLGLSTSKRHQVADGRNPYYEYSLGYSVPKPKADDMLPTLRDRYSMMPPALPGKEHHPGKYTLAQYKNTEDFIESEGRLRYMVPPPQRPRSDIKDRPYTKSPDYVRNYEKTPAHALKTAS
ncbi:hypothetical protein CVT26_009657 [Gymnopilus dilepis]|uniref:Uncharacterized protein n=1 Tax=Gymnopilus dilepis TaxID=231916 RepID=A0A409VKM3_9AGAR|nr:hypothetical protein CVT26_009657 [Gymnopilus dilepis]